MEAYIKTIPDGHVIVAACKDDCMYRLSQDVKAWFARMGSKEVWNLEYRQGFSFIGVNGEWDAIEKRANKVTDQVSVTQVFEVFNAKGGGFELRRASKNKMILV